MTTYTVGPLLGMFLIALLGGGRGSVKGFIAGALISFVLVFFVRNDVWVLFMNDSLAVTALSMLPSYELVEGTPNDIQPTSRLGMDVADYDVSHDGNGLGFREVKKRH